MTGLQVGGISPLALINKGFAIYLDELAQAQEQIFISAGERGLQIKLAPADLVKLTRARLADVSSGELRELRPFVQGATRQAAPCQRYNCAAKSPRLR